MVNPYVFIVGCARSGTTLLHRLVDAYPLVAVIHETHWITNYFKERAEHQDALGVQREFFNNLEVRQELC